MCFNLEQKHVSQNAGYLLQLGTQFCDFKKQTNLVSVWRDRKYILEIAEKKYNQTHTPTHDAPKGWLFDAEPTT